MRSDDGIRTSSLRGLVSETTHFREISTLRFHETLTRNRRVCLQEIHRRLFRGICFRLPELPGQATATPLGPAFKTLERCSHCTVPRPSWSLPSSAAPASAAKSLFSGLPLPGRGGRGAAFCYQRNATSPERAR